MGARRVITAAVLLLAIAVPSLAATDAPVLLSNAWIAPRSTSCWPGAST
jgi:hypothetical protein